MKILIAEDDAFLRRAYNLKMKTDGNQVLVVENGQEAIDALDDFKPDVILLDLVMPVLDGFATLEQLKSNEHWAQIPVIVATNLGQNEDQKKALDLGAQEYITKSDLSLDELISKINSVVQKQ